MRLGSSHTTQAKTSSQRDTFLPPCLDNTTRTIKVISTAPLLLNPFYPPSLLKTFSNYTRIRVENPYSSSAEVKLRKFDREAGNNFARFEDGILNRRERQLSTSYERLSWFWRRLDLSLRAKVTIKDDFCSILSSSNLHLSSEIDPCSNFPIDSSPF